VVQEEEMDPYTRALEESMKKLPKEETGAFLLIPGYFILFLLHLQLSNFLVAIFSQLYC
jgi:hypothetical protein